MLTEVAIRALRDANVKTTEVDTILLIPCLHSFDDQADLVFSRMVEELGLQGQAKTSFMVHSGGSTSDNAVRTASGLIASGHARTVLVLQAERWGSADLEEMVTMLTLNGIPQEWERASGMSFNAIGALIHERYMHDTGSTPEDMAGICVSLRKWAQLNPNAMFKDRELTVEKVLASKMICDPLHAMECPPLADGAAAFVMTSRENADGRVDKAVRVAGSGGCVSHYSIGQERNPRTRNLERSTTPTQQSPRSEPRALGCAQRVTPRAGSPPERPLQAEIFPSTPTAVCCRPAIPESGAAQPFWSRACAS